MPRPYTQLVLVNMLLAVLFSTTVQGAPVIPSLAGAIWAGALLYAVGGRMREASRSPAIPGRGEGR